MKPRNLVMVASVLLAFSYAAEASTPNSGRSIFRPAALEPPILNSGARPQGPLGGPQVAVIENLQGDVRVARAALRTNVTRVNATDSNGLTRVTAPGLGLASGDIVQTLQGKADIRFTDQSIIKLDAGTTVTITERQAGGGIQRTIQQFIGY